MQLNQAFAVINIHWPIYSIFNALGIGLGIAGVGIISVYIGSNKRAEAIQVCQQTGYLCSDTRIVVNILLFVFAPIHRKNDGCKWFNARLCKLAYFRYRSFEFSFVYLFLAYQSIATSRW